MQAVARELNQSETAFIWPIDNAWSLRWFTPQTEVDLCGHATLATAHVLWHELEQGGDELEFHTRSGVLKARRGDSGIELDFPTDSVVEIELDGLENILGHAPQQIYRGRDDLLVVLDSAQKIRDLKPDLAQLAELPYRALIATAASDQAPWQIVSRVFGPRIGIAEDPVTGSSHCTLFDYWSKQLDLQHIHAYQASARGGELYVSQQGERILLSGDACTVLRGTIDGA